MMNIDLTGKWALVAGVADDTGYGFAIAKALAEGGAFLIIGTWPPTLGIFHKLLGKRKLDESRKLQRDGALEFERIYPLDAAFDTLADPSEKVRINRRQSGWESGTPKK
jgi:enoyl-[acyl-carrier protein] reductase I